MMNRLFILLLCLPSFLQAQNLVPNPGFEDTISCPSNISNSFGNEIYNLSGWFPSGRSPDYFNSCAVYHQSQNQASVPQNGYGYQFAKDGSGYIGLYTVRLTSTVLNYREYVGIQLSQPLEIDSQYFCTFYVSAAYDNFQLVWTFSNKLGIFLSNTYYESLNNPLTFNNNPTAFSDSIISDTTNWTLMQFVFTADSAYNYFYIGNFFENALTDTIQTMPGGSGSYYYIDRVCLSKSSSCNTTSSLDDQSSISPKPVIFPNPTKDFIYFNYPLNTKAFIYDNSNRLLKTFYIGKGFNKVDIEELKNGIYFFYTEDRSIVEKIIKL